VIDEPLARVNPFEYRKPSRCICDQHPAAADGVEQCIQTQCLSEMLRVRAHVRAKMQLAHAQWIHIIEQLIQPEKPP
jgi:hypothetical protein